VTLRVTAAGCRTALGDAAETCSALLKGVVALTPVPALGAAGGDLVPLALLGNRTLDEAAPPAWLPVLDELVAEAPAADWGNSRHPVFVTSSNFGVGSLYGFHRGKDPAHLAYATPFQAVEQLRVRFGWGPDVTLLSHACVSAHLGLLAASRRLEAGQADRALVFSFDFISPFVTGGFNALKILNAGMPAPYCDRTTGSIGLGDGCAYAVVERGGSGLAILGQSLYNEMHHFTANRSDGSGFAGCVRQIAGQEAGRKLWIKGHGTGTIEAGKLEAEMFARIFPDSPLVSWKGSIGHTLGSCGLVEIAIAAAALRGGVTPGTVGSSGPVFGPTVATSAFGNRSFDAVLIASNAFGGAHAACLLGYD
jgi:3-oxoacyl-(acyl-carrier-protein) synthase